MSFILLLPNLKHLWLSFTNRKSQLNEDVAPLIYKKQYYIFLKIVVLLVFGYESQYKLITSGSFNDDNAPRPELHGAYQVLDGSKGNWQMIYFHRQGYFIVEDDAGTFYDFKLNVNGNDHLLELTTYDLEKQVLQYQLQHDTLTIQDDNTGFIVMAVKVYSYNHLQLN
jgi:hypothetical protein